MFLTNRSLVSCVWVGFGFVSSVLASPYTLESIVNSSFEALATQGQDEQAEEAPADEPDFWSGWQRSIEAGLTGSSGNNDTINLRAIVQTQRETDRLRTMLRGRYLYGKDGGTISQDEARLRGENDWKFPGERYFVFSQVQYDYDRFQDWDTRFQGFAGGGYEFLKERSLLENGQDRASLRGRLGFGVNREFGGDDTKWHPEALIGLDFTWAIDDRNTFSAGTEIFPSLDDLGEFRALNYAHYEVKLSNARDIRLRLGAEHEYDSEPGTAEENNINYYVTILMTF